MEHSRSQTGRAIDALRVHLAQQVTGCLRVHIPARGDCAVFVMDGEVIAALTDCDPVAIVDRLVARAKLSAEQASQLKADFQGQANDFEILHRRVDPPLVGRLMAGRFRNNLIFHLFDGSRYVFEPMQTVRVPHLQIGHDSAGLLRELELIYEQVAPWLAARRTIRLGEYTPGSPQQRHIQALCASGLGLDMLLSMSPFSQAQTLLLVSGMVEAGSLVAEDVSDGPTTGAISHAIKAAQATQLRRGRASPLAAFGDHGQADRGLGKGAFVGDKDRVDLGEVVENRVPGLRLAAPRLSRSEVLRRVGVCNEVLTALVTAWNEQHGVGSGRAVAQRLVDGAPRGSDALFRALEVDAMGRIGASDILDNLGRRPEGEHRELVIKGLTSLIDRALGQAAEGLSDERLNQMLVFVAGYRERMGW